MFVLPTSMARSIRGVERTTLRRGAASGACQRASRRLDANFPYPVALGDRVPVALGAADPGVLTVETRGASQRDEKLARARVATRERHSDVCPLERSRRCLAPQELARASIAIPARIAELREGSGDDPMKRSPRVETRSSERRQTRDGDGRVDRIEHERERPGVGIEGDANRRRELVT